MRKFKKMDFPDIDCTRGSTADFISKDDDGSLGYAVKYALEKEESLLRSGLGKIISKCRVPDDCELDKQFDTFLENSIDLIDALNQVLDVVLDDKIFPEIEGLDESILNKFKEEAEVHTPRPLIDISDNEVWQNALLDIIEGKWEITPNIEDLSQQSFILRHFYLKALKAKEISLHELLPSFLEVEEKLKDLVYVMGFLIGDDGGKLKKMITASKKGRTLKKTKYYKSWAEMITLMGELDKEGVFDQAINVETVATETRFVMVCRKKEKQFGHVHSLKTIKSCLGEYFGITPETFCQPLNLADKV